MASKLTKGLKPTHPGEILREDVLPALTSQDPFARFCMFAPDSLRSAREKQPVTPDALRWAASGTARDRLAAGPYDLRRKGAMAGELIYGRSKWLRTAGGERGRRGDTC